jgi:hypothetical protein
MSHDGEMDETRRNATIAIAVAVAAVTMVGLLFWIFNSLSRPALAVGPAAKTATSAPTSAAAPVAAPTTDTPPPTIASWTPTTTVSLPPPEQPTVTEPVPAQTADQPQPTTQAAPAPPAPSITNLNLQCAKADRRGVAAKLTFTTTTKVDVVLAAGSQVEHKSAGPGNVSLAASGRAPDICFAKVGDQTVGPVPAT